MPRDGAAPVSVNVTERVFNIAGSLTIGTPITLVSYVKDSLSGAQPPYRREESDGCVVPVKPRTKPTTNRQRRESREGGRSKERRAATHAPDSEPGRRVTEA